MARKILSLVLSFGLLFQQVSFAQVALELNLANYLSRFGSNIVQDKFRPIHLRYFSYDSLNNSFKLLVDKGDELSRGIEGKGIGKGEEIPEEALKDKTQTLLNYFLIGVTLPDSMFWVNLRPDSEDQIIDQYLEKTDVGKIMLETDLQLKKDTALFTSPNTPEGKEYWTKLYQKAEELYGYESVNIPTLTRPWIVPGEIILREAEDSAYIYKATLKVMLESDYLANSTNPVIANNSVYQFKDERSKALNEYSSGLIRELIIPKLTKEVNSSRRYANFRQVYYSLILSRWFKQRFKGLSPSRVSESTLKGAVPAFTALIETKNLTNLISKDAWSKTDYFKLYQKSFAEGEYNVKEPVYTPTGQMIRSYFSGGINMGREAGSPINNPNSFIGRPINPNIFNTGIVADGDSLRGIKISASPITTKGMPDYRREYDLMEAHNRIERQARSGPYIDLLKGVVLNGKGILSDTASRSLLYSATDSVNRVLRENLIRHPRSSYYDEKRLLSEIADGRYYLIKDFGKEESLNGLAEIAAQRLATLMVLKKNQLLSILYSDNPRVIILSNVLKEKGYTVKSPGEEDSTTGSFTLLVNFATTLDKAGNLLNCESKFKLLANAAIMVLPDISTPTGMLTAIRIFSRARAFFDAASSLPVTAAGSAVTSLVSAIVTETKDADNYLTTLQAEVKKENPNINIILTMERNLEVLYKNGVFPSQSLFNDLKELIERLNSSNDLVAIDAAITLRFYLNEETLEILNIKIDELNKEKEKRYRLIGKVVDARDKIKKHLDSEKSKSAAGSPIISDLAKAVEQEQSLLEEDVNEQVLKFTVVTDENGKPLHPISPEDSVMVGHVRGDRAGYFARGLWSRGFKKLLGYIKFSNDYQGKSVLSDEVIAKVPNTFFEILSNKMYKVLKISENEKKDHVGNNADGKKTDGPYPGEKRINIEMQKSKKAYADTPQMKTKECTDEVLRGLDDDTIDFILVNLLGSDMMKHTGNFKSAKQANEITDQQIGRIKEKIDSIKRQFIKKIREEVSSYPLDERARIILDNLLLTDYDSFLIRLKEINQILYSRINGFEARIPIFVITADHGASEAGLTENPKESDTFHTANPVPYIIYDPLRTRKLTLKSGQTIRNNGATLLHLLGEDIPEGSDPSLLPDDYQGSKRRIAMAVLDGWGINPDQNYEWDAIKLANTPNYDWLVKNACGFTQLQAHGEVIGLRKELSWEEGRHHLRGLQAGQTDVGHFAMFALREYKQPLWYVDRLVKGGIRDGIFDESMPEVQVLVKELQRVKENDLRFHYITIASEGGVHSSLYHMYALMRLAKKLDLRKDQFVIHFAADGRDVPTRSAHLYIQDIEKRIEKIGIGIIASVWGRDKLVRKDAEEETTNRIIDVETGIDLNTPDVTRVIVSAASPVDVSTATWDKVAKFLDEHFGKNIMSDATEYFILPNLLVLVNSQISPDTISKGGLLQVVAKLDRDGRFRILLGKSSEGEVLSVELKGKGTGSSPVQSAPETTGGIDLRSLPMTIQPTGSFKGLNFSLPVLSQEQLRQINITSEIEQIRNMVKAGNIPSGDRLKELIAACCQKKEINAQVDNLLLCLIDICKLEEESALESSAELREALVIVDSIS